MDTQKVKNWLLWSHVYPVFTLQKNRFFEGKKNFWNSRNFPELQKTVSKIPDVIVTGYDRYITYTYEGK